MSRPKKINNIVDNNDIENIENENSKVEELELKLAKMSELLESLMQNKNNIEQKNSNDDYIDDVEENKIKINSDDYIKVISLCPEYLILRTTPYGQKGDTYEFEKYGEVKRILYGAVTRIIDINRKFLEQGKFAIMNSKVIRRHGLDDVLGKVLTKETIDKILAGNQSDAVNLFKTANDNQRENIARMLMDRLIAGEEIDLNFLDRLSRIIGYNIQQRASEMKFAAQAVGMIKKDKEEKEEE
jgi:TolA-binding protein